MKEIKAKIEQEKLDCLGYLYDYKQDYLTAEEIQKIKTSDPENFVFTIGKIVHEKIVKNDNSSEYEAGKVDAFNYVLSLLDKTLDK